MAYASLADLKTYLASGGWSGGTGDDTLLTDLLARAQAIIDRETGRTFEASADSTRKFDAVRDVDGPTLYLDEDLAQITSVTNGDGVAVASTNYVAEPRNRTPSYALRLLGSSSVAWTYDDDPENAISIAGRWAYSVSAPDDIKHATIRLAAWLYRQRSDAAKDDDRPILANGVWIMPSRLPQDVASTLAEYRKVW